MDELTVLGDCSGFGPVHTHYVMLGCIGFFSSEKDVSNKCVHVWFTVYKKVGSKEKKMGKEDENSKDGLKDGWGRETEKKQTFCASILGASWEH